MKTNPTVHTRLMSLVSSSALWAAALPIAGLIGGLWFERTDNSAWKEVPLVAVLVLTVVMAITRQQARASARRRLQTVLAAYAEREIRQQRPSTSWPPASSPIRLQSGQGDIRPKGRG
jgi:hypothetical protein